MQSHLPASLSKIIRTYFLGLGIFTLFRLILLVSEWHRLGDTYDIATIFQAFLMGIRFDTVILCYILALPFLLLSVGLFLPKANLKLEGTVRFLIILLCSIAFGISAADIPYFNHFFSRLSITALEWMDSPMFVLGMIVQEPKYWLILLPAILLTWSFTRIVLRIFDTTNRPTRRIANIAFTLVGVLLLVAGMRGRLAHKSPIRFGTAYFSQSAFLNQLGLNPNFTFLKSYLLSKKKENQGIHFMSDSLALSMTQHFLAIENKDTMSISRIQGISPTQHNLKNVVVILMESMSANKMTRHGNPHNLTPFLDSLSHKSAYYPNAYSAGIHTFNGIFSSLFSLPAIYRKHPMKGAVIAEYDGLFENTKKQGHHTIYFCTHDGQFDNVEGFLTANKCDEIIAADDYPSEEIKSTLGVPDDYMFRTAVPKLTQIASTNTPFTAVVMTASDHGPYYIPPYFNAKSKDKKQQIVEYADWSLRTFFEQSKEQPWYDSTLFVLVADHGAVMHTVYDMPLSFNHVPLLFFAPNGEIPAQVNPEVTGQLDVFPTIMDYLNLPFENKTLGTNLRDTGNRPYMYFNGDDKYGVLDHDWFLIQKEDGSSGLYRYQVEDLTNYAAAKKAKVDSMRAYAESQLQTYQYILKNNKR